MTRSNSGSGSRTTSGQNKGRRNSESRTRYAIYDLSENRWLCGGNGVKIFKSPAWADAQITKIESLIRPEPVGRYEIKEFKITSRQYEPADRKPVLLPISEVKQKAG